MAAGGWRPPMRKPFAAAGRHALATITGQLVNMRDGGFISAHDFHIGKLIAGVVCGGDVAVEAPGHGLAGARGGVRGHRASHASLIPEKICRRSGWSQLRNVVRAATACVAHDPPRSTR